MALIGAVAVVAGSIAVPFAFLLVEAPWPLADTGAAGIICGIFLTLLGDRVSAPARLRSNPAHAPRFYGLPVRVAARH